jgi:predicted transposase/invertase (TIGR01784 family)
MEEKNKQKHKYIDPFTDFGFKKLFGEECSKDLLLDFLNELLHKQEGKIVSLSYLKNEQLGRSAEDRKAVFDLHCENEKGEQFIVEMQKTKQTFFKDRALYYSTFPIVKQAISGSWNYELKAVYTVAVLDFVFDEDKDEPDKYRYDVMLSDIETHKIFYDKLVFTYLSMPKFNKKIEDLETRFDKWMYVLKNLQLLQDLPDKLRERIFEKIFSVAEIAKLSNEEYHQYIESFKTYRDYKNSIDTARDEGRAEGKAERDRLETDLKTVKAKKDKDKNEIALKLIKKGIPIEDVSGITGLTKEEVVKIMNFCN